MNDNQYLTYLNLDNITVFEELHVSFTTGINIFIGKNGTGKTHLLKILYSACDITRTKSPFPEKLVRVFLPLGSDIGRLVRRCEEPSLGHIDIGGTSNSVSVAISNRAEDFRKLEESEIDNINYVFKNIWLSKQMECVYIPVKEMLANAPGFLSLYEFREIHFEEIYADILRRAFRPLLKGTLDLPRKKILEQIERCIHGKVIQKEEMLFLGNRRGNIEFTLLAEGMRKLALLWQLIQNGTLMEGSILFWDEPEANLNPAMMGDVVDILLQLQRLGIQIFLATHDYVLLKEFDQRITERDSVRFHSLYEDSDSVKLNSTEQYLEIHPNAISETFHTLLSNEVQRALGGH